MTQEPSTVLRDQLRLAVYGLRYIAELQGCHGFVPEEASEAAALLDGPALAVFVTLLADNVDYIADPATAVIVGRTRKLVAQYVASGTFPLPEYVAACDAYNQPVSA